MYSRLSSPTFRSLLLILLISAVLTAGPASSSDHFATKHHVNTLNNNKNKLEQVIVYVKEECKNTGGGDLCGPCLADILKVLEEDAESSIAGDDNTSSQQASASEGNIQNNEGTASTHSKCGLIISKTKDLIKRNAELKQQLQTTEQKIIEQDQTITQKEQDIISKDNSLAICSSLLKECQSKECPPAIVCPPTVGCEKCEEDLRAAKIALMLSQNENTALKGKIQEYEESLNSWNKLLLSSLPQAGSEVLSLQEFSSHTKINVTALAGSLGNLLTLANSPSDNFLETSQNYQNEVSSLSDSFVKFVQSTFSFAAASSQTKKQCQSLFKDYKQAVDSLSQCNDVLTGQKQAK